MATGPGLKRWKTVVDSLLGALKQGKLGCRSRRNHSEARLNQMPGRAEVQTPSFFWWRGLSVKGALVVSDCPGSPCGGGAACCRQFLLGSISQTA